MAVDGGGSRALVSFGGSVWLADLKARTASELVLLPDGVHALVVDPGNDQLTLIE